MQTEIVEVAVLGREVCTHASIERCGGRDPGRPLALRCRLCRAVLLELPDDIDEMEDRR